MMQKSPIFKSLLGLIEKQRISWRELKPDCLFRAWLLACEIRRFVSWARRNVSFRRLRHFRRFCSVRTSNDSASNEFETHVTCHALSRLNIRQASVSFSKLRSRLVKWGIQVLKSSVKDFSMEQNDYKQGFHLQISFLEFWYNAKIFLINIYTVARWVRRVQVSCPATLPWHTSF